MPCNPPQTNADKRWRYGEYYYGERDEENRKHGMGSHHWSGAETLEWYTGRMLRDTMHGDGEYRRRYFGPDHLATTYEGRLYNNCMHGYGVMSYPDGCVFNGLWYKNIRWGPGVESHACVREDVGLWYGCQLIRLAWSPAVPSVAIDLVSNPVGAALVAPHRVLLTSNVTVIGETNSALDLLKQSGCEPVLAADKWSKLYSKHCTDLSSQLCHVEAFDRAYYDKEIKILSEVTPAKPFSDDSVSSTDNNVERTTYYAWNNNKIITHMMKHCFTHDEQKKDRINIEKILCGPRSAFKLAGKHELDCRMLIMASYLGHTPNVAQLINECDVEPNVTDIQGNSVLMYAACGDQLEVMEFLVEAGAEVDAYNDACCTPLGIALLRYALEKRGVAYSGMLQALLPANITSGPRMYPDLLKVPYSLVPDPNILEWNINRNLSPPVIDQTNKANNKINDTKKSTMKDLNVGKKKLSKTEMKKPSIIDASTSTDTTQTEDKRVYNNINTEYLIRVAEAFSVLSEANPIPYIFEVNDMVKEIIAINEDEAKKIPDKQAKNAPPKVVKELVKPSRDNMWQDKEDAFVNAIDNAKQNKLNAIMATIIKLLSQGADPKKVRCPQSAVFIATVAGCADLIHHLKEHGADINEVYPQVFGYSNLDVAVSAPLTRDSLEVIRALLECGADPDHRLQIHTPSSLPGNREPPEINKVDGPTLLHVVLAKKVDAEVDPHLAMFRDEILELLLQYGCNPITQYNGSSAVDMAMNKSLDLFNICIQSPRTDLNAIINSSNQSILVKMFHFQFCKTIPLPERIQTLTSLLLFGADPLIKCQNEDEEYENLFVFTKSLLKELESKGPEAPGPAGVNTIKNAKRSKLDLKTKNPATKPSGKGEKEKPASDNPNDYKQAVDLVLDCARLLYIRWLQAKLLKELFEIVYKFKHRHWTMILKEHKNKKCVSLWLTAVRSLEIWDILKTTKKNIYNDEKLLNQVLCIVHFYCKRSLILRYSLKIKQRPILFQEKELIEDEVASFMREHKIAKMSALYMATAMRPYVTPELTTKQLEKFNICFECAIPLTDEKIPCDLCKLVHFCTLDCMKTNIGRVNCHPCSNYLKEKYFPTPEEAESTIEEI